VQGDAENPLPPWRATSAASASAPLMRIAARLGIEPTAMIRLRGRRQLRPAEASGWGMGAPLRPAQR